MYEELSKEERDRFRARKSYWRKKGFPDEAAYEKAIEPIKLRLVAKCKSNDLMEPEKKLNNFRVGLISTKQSSGLSNAKKTSKSADQLKRLFNGSSPELEIQKSKTRSLVLGFLPLTGLLLMVIVTLFQLVSSSLMFFGMSWQGLLKAILLEVAILIFSVSSASGTLEWCIKRFSAAFLIGLSFFVLHAGVEINRHQEMTSLTNQDTVVRLLQERRERLLATHDQLPTNYSTKRNDLLNQIEEIDTQILDKIDSLRRSQPAQVVDLSSKTESLFRVALLLISIVFSHSLAKEAKRLTQKLEVCATG